MILFPARTAEMIKDKEWKSYVVAHLFSHSWRVIYGSQHRRQSAGPWRHSGGALGRVPSQRRQRHCPGLWIVGTPESENRNKTIKLMLNPTNTMFTGTWSAFNHPDNKKKCYRYISNQCSFDLEGDLHSEGRGNVQVCGSWVHPNLQNKKKQAIVKPYKFYKAYFQSPWQTLLLVN